MAFKTFGVNEYLTSADVNAYLTQQQVARKTSTESVTSSTTLQDDNDLFMTLSASTNYWLDGILITDGAVGGDFKLQFVLPSGWIRWIANGPVSGATATVTDTDRNWKVTATSTVMGTIASGTSSIVHVAGILRIGTSGGTFKLQWAQGTSSGTATRVFANSFLRCTRMLA
ncbi:hypothetical protein [Nonomuraea typhae]|uniref:hypothetical protein n=1 Tax=Nonomuraea typhae TaxID=2603600 RepID=UPI0012FC75A7|nr:hypothetical protein [Nonomuraea typhae]